MGRADMQLHTDLGDGLSPPEAILDAAEHASLDVIAITDHDDIRASFLTRDLAARGDDTFFVDGIELRNPSYAGRVRAARAEWLNAHVLRVAQTGSSDAHHAALVGTAWTQFEGTTAAQLRAAIAARATVAAGRRWTLREHLDGALRQQWRSMLRDPAKRVWRRYARPAPARQR